MLTKNFVKMLFAMWNGRVAKKEVIVHTLDDFETSVTIWSSSSSSYTQSVSYEDIMCTIYGNIKDIIISPTSSGLSRAFAFGTGNTAPRFDDYTMAGDLITTLVIDANKASETIDGNKTKYVQNLTVRNTGTNTVTIKEVGRVYGATYTNYKYVLLDRVVLDAPLTLAPEESGVIRLTVNLPIV